jgi:hypothetical protein
MTRRRRNTRHPADPGGVRLSRRDLALRAAGLCGGLALARTPAALAQGGDDRELIERALDVERRLAGLYERASFAAADLFGEQCGEHARGLELALRNRGGLPRGATRAPSGAADAAAALRLETRAVAACYNAVGELRDGRLLPAFAAIMASHGQHLVVLREALGRDPIPAALETGGVQ